MALTRHATGHSAPRKTEPTLAARIKAPFTTKKTTTTTTTTTTAAKPRTSSGAKANSSEPRARATTGGRVTKSKPGRPPLKNKPRKTSVKDKVEGALEKVVGTVEGRPGKKAAGTKKIRGTDGKGTTRAKR